jgi:hypothetical protein
MNDDSKQETLPGSNYEFTQVFLANGLLEEGFNEDDLQMAKQLYFVTCKNLHNQLILSDPDPITEDYVKDVLERLVLEEGPNLGEPVTIASIRSVNYDEFTAQDLYNLIEAASKVVSNKKSSKDITPIGYIKEHVDKEDKKRFSLAMLVYTASRELPTAITQFTDNLLKRIV